MATNSDKNNSFTKNFYRPEIDGIRAFAVVAVIINHFNKEILPGGYLGVDIFFVISGFVITSSLYRRPSKNFKDFISGFYTRRIKRLIPALSIFVLITSIGICLFDPSPNVSLRTGITSLFGLSNIYLFKNSIDYFAQSTDLNVFTHTWSLGVEEQFYFIFPFLIWFSGFGRKTKNGVRNLFISIAVLTITSLITFLYLYPNNQPAAYFLMPSRFWEMAAGSLLFIGCEKKKSLKNFLEKIPPLLIISLIIGAMYLPITWGRISTIAIVLFSSILIASLKKQRAIFTFFSHPSIVYIGLISYSLYLWHWAVLSISRWTIGIHWWSIPLQITLILGLAISSYQWIEKPIRTKNWFRRRWQTLIIGGGLIVSASGSLYALSKPLKGKIYLGKKISCSSYQYETCTADDYPHRATTPFIQGTNIQRENCANEFGLYQGPLNKKMIQSCSVNPAEEKSPTIFVTGSSHSHHFSVVFDSLRKEFGIGISMSTVGSCDLDPLFLQENGSRTCKDSNKNRISFIKNYAKKGDVIFTGVTPSHYIFDKNSVEKVIEIARTQKLSVIYFTPIPIWKILNTRNDICSSGDEIQWYRPKGTLNCNAYSQININTYEEKQSKIIDYLKKIEEKNDFFHVFPIHEILCDSSKCPSHINGIRLYRDNWGHVSIPATKKYLDKEIRHFMFERKIIKINN